MTASPTRKSFVLFLRHNFLFIVVTTVVKRILMTSPPPTGQLTLDCTSAAAVTCHFAVGIGEIIFYWRVQDASALVY